LIITGRVCLKEERTYLMWERRGLFEKRERFWRNRDSRLSSSWELKWWVVKVKVVAKLCCSSMLV